ncbi:MAG: galactokinase family protein, partial [Phycisphaerales bacterium]
MQSTAPATALSRCVDAFARRFGGAPATVARAPGRVNLVGEHVDYCDGLVLPIAIDRDCVVAVRRATDGRWRAWSEDLQSLVELPDPAAHASSPRLVGGEAWGNLLTGVMVGFLREGASVPPLEIAVASDVPIGAGLASSSALGVAVATALADVLSAPLFGIALARMCQEAEQQFLGVPCGMMDHLSSPLGVAAIGKRAVRAGIDHPERRHVRRRKRHRTDVERPAVDEHRMPLAAERRRQVVNHAAWHAEELLRGLRAPRRRASASRWRGPQGG